MLILILNCSNFRFQKKEKKEKKERKKETILERVTCQIINKEKNEEMLASVPHKNVCDLAVIYRCIVDVKEESTGSFVINNKMMKDYAQKYGPLSLSTADSSSKEWKWALQPMPWEGGC